MIILLSLYCKEIVKFVYDLQLIKSCNVNLNYTTCEPWLAELQAIYYQSKVN